MNNKIFVEIEEALNLRNIGLKSISLSKINIDDEARIQKAFENRNNTTHQTLYDYLCPFIRRKGFVKKSGKLDEAAFYRSVDVDKTTWSDVRNHIRTLSHEALLRTIFMLKMDESEANQMMQLASDALNPSDARDNLVLALLDIHCYNIADVAEAMEKYGKDGAHPFKNIYPD